MDRYERVAKPKDESPIAENEIRITSTGRARNCITYAMALLQVFCFFRDSENERVCVDSVSSMVTMKNWYEYCYELV